MTNSSAQARVALVTGASKGLGAAIAVRLGQDGFVVAVNYFEDSNGAAAVVNEITSSNGRAMAFQADVTDENDVSKLIHDIEEQLGPVDVLVLNATGPQPLHGIEELEWQIMLDQLDYFVKSPVLLVTC